MGPLSLLGGFKVIIYTGGWAGGNDTIITSGNRHLMKNGRQNVYSQLRGGKECVRLFGLLLKGIKAPLHH